MITTPKSLTLIAALAAVAHAQQYPTQAQLPNPLTGWSRMCDTLAMHLRANKIAMFRLRLALLATLLALSSSAEAATKVIRFGKLWDGHNTIANAVVVIENDKIQSVAANAPVPAGAELIDLSRYTGIPGMIDVHTHMTYYWDPASGTDPRRQPPRHVAVTVFLAQANAMKTLEAGVTTVRDLGAQNYSDIAMRDLINMGQMKGPRMFVAGYGLIAPRPGHDWPTNVRVGPWP